MSQNALPIILLATFIFLAGLGMGISIQADMGKSDFKRCLGIHGDVNGCAIDVFGLDKEKDNGKSAVKG